MGTVDRTVFFEMRLVPYRSLSRRGFHLLLGALGGLSLTVGTIFWLAGAWPVIGFMGIDVLLLWAALRVSYARAKAYEQVRLTGESLIVERVAPNGAMRRWNLPPTWLQVELAEPVRHDSPVRLRTHGKALEMGLLLAPEPRRQFAHSLRQALADWRFTPRESGDPSSRGYDSRRRGGAEMDPRFRGE
jgi:uncharacterized membrane protein